MTIVLKVFDNLADRAIFSWKCKNVEQAIGCYRGLLERAVFEKRKRKPRVISTRIILDKDGA